MWWHKSPFCYVCYITYVIIQYIEFIVKNKRMNKFIPQTLTSLDSCFTKFSSSTGQFRTVATLLSFIYFKSVFYTCISLFFISNFIPSYIKFRLAFMSLSILFPHSLQWYFLLFKSFMLLSLCPH